MIPIVVAVILSIFVGAALSHWAYEARAASRDEDWRKKLAALNEKGLAQRESQLLSSEQYLKQLETKNAHLAEQNRQLKAGIRTVEDQRDESNRQLGFLHSDNMELNAKLMTAVSDEDMQRNSRVDAAKRIKEFANELLICSCQYGSPESASLAVSYGADPNLIDDNQRTPFLIAVMFGQCGVANFLASSGADAKIPLTGRYGIVTAIEDGNVETVEALCKCIRMRSVVSPKGNDLLSYALLIYTSDKNENRFAIMKALLESGCNANPVSPFNGVPLLNGLVRDPIPGVLPLLLAFRPDVTVWGEDGENALTLALKKNDQTILAMFNELMGGDKWQRTSRDILEASTASQRKRGGATPVSQASLPGVPSPSRAAAHIARWDRSSDDKPAAHGDPYMAREDGRFGSYPEHDDYGDEADA